MSLLAEPDASLEEEAEAYTEAEGSEALELAGRMSNMLETRAPTILNRRAYFNGKHPMAFATKKWRETFGRDFGMIVDNWCRIVVTAAIERMSIQGFRFGMDETAAVDQAHADATEALRLADAPQNVQGALDALRALLARDPDEASGGEPDDADDAAWAIWQRNGLDLDSDLAHTEMLSTGYSYTLTWPDEDDRNVATITVEDPLQTIVLHDPANRRRRIAGFKRWRELDGQWRALLFTPTHVWSLAGGKGERHSPAPKRWGIAAVDDNPIGRVPIVEFVNDPDIYGHGRSAFEEGIQLNDAINKLLADMMIASEFTSYRQRVLIGVEIPTGPDGQPDSRVVTGANRWIGLEAAVDEDGKQVQPHIQELQTSDLSSYVNGLELLTQHFAALTRTPPHYLLGKLVNVSADALIASQDGLIARTRRAMRFAGECWEETERLAFLIEGDRARGRDTAAETMWADPETTSESQRADSLVKYKNIGVPLRALWEMDGRSPATIKRWTRWAEREAQLDAVRMGIGAGGLGTDMTDGDAAAGAGGA